MTGGNARASGYARNADDWYQEPARAVTALFEAERFFGDIHDPACGGGNIPAVAREFGYVGTGADLVDRGAGDVQDFLEDGRHYDNIVCNPPFNMGVAFTFHALAHVPPDGKVAILQRLAWLEGTARHGHLFGPGYLHRVWVFSGRISMPPGGLDVPAKNGSVAYAWFVFSPIPRRGMADLGWLP